MNLLKFFRRFLREDSGSVMPMIGVAFASLMGTGGLTLDAGHCYFSYRQLQASTNAAALAGAKQLPNTTATTVATLYSSVAGNKNVKAGLPNVTMVSGYPMLKCLTTLQNQGLPCLSPANANAIQVKQTVNLPLYFASMFGKSTEPMTASATASMRGGSPTQYNVAIVLDTTLSMNSTDDNCGTTEMQCELNGVQTLLQSMTPCVTSSLTCTFTNGVATNSVDRVALFAFPNVLSSTASIDSTCTTPIANTGTWNYGASDPPYGVVDFMFLTPGWNGWSTNTTITPSWPGVPSAYPYSSPTAGATSYSGTTEAVSYLDSHGTAHSVGNYLVTYQITPFLSDYKTSPSALTLNTSSALVKAAGGGLSCGGILPPNFDGNFGTSYVGALYAAQSALVAQQTANPGSQNVLILLSDGNANTQQSWDSTVTMPAGSTSSSSYPSYIGQCGQGVVAGLAATAAGTRVYSVAYGALDNSASWQSSSSEGACPTDVGAGAYPNITPCQALKDIASSAQNFYSDYNQTGSGSNCTSTQPMTALSDIFAAIGKDLTVSRLIPDSVR